MDNFYANSSVSSPSRAALLTGRFPAMVGVPGVIRPSVDQNWGYFDPSAVTMPEVLKNGGYRTALIGKWHLGWESPNLPNERGFDHFHGFLADMMDDYYTHQRQGGNYMYLNDNEITPKGHATELFTSWSVNAGDLAAQRGGEFGYRATHVPHCGKARVQRFDDIRRHALDRALRDGHAFADDFVDGQVVDGLLHGVVRGDAAQFGRNRERHLETVSDALFEVVTAVEGVELHALKIDRVEHRRMQYAQSGRFLYGAFPIAMKLIRRSRDSSSSCRAARAGICRRSDRLR